MYTISKKDIIHNDIDIIITKLNFIYIACFRHKMHFKGLCIKNYILVKYQQTSYSIKKHLHQHKRLKIYSHLE